MVLAILALAVATQVMLKISGRTLAQAVGFDNGRSASLAGVETFYNVDYHDGQEVCVAQLCALSTEPARDFYLNTVALILWPDFETSKSMITAKAGDHSLFI